MSVVSKDHTMRRILNCLVGSAALVMAAISAAQAQVGYQIEIVPNTSHSYWINAVAFAPSGSHVVTAGDKTLKLWDVETGQLVRTFVHSKEVTSVVFSPNGARLASGYVDNVVKLWDAATGKLLQTLQDGNLVTTVAFSPSGKELLSGGYGNSVKLWDVSSGRLIRSFAVPASTVKIVAFSPDGNRVLAGGSDAYTSSPTLNVWDGATGRLLHSLQAQFAGGVISMAFSRDGRQVLAIGGDGTQQSWDAFSGRPIETYRLAPREGQLISYSPDGAHAFTRTPNGKFTLWDIRTQRSLASFEGHAVGGVSVVAFSPDGSRLLSGGPDMAAKLWDAKTGMLLRSFEGPAEVVSSIVYSKAGLLSAGGKFQGKDFAIKLWDVVSGRLMRTMAGHTDSVSALALSHDGKRLLSGGSNKAVNLWDLATGQKVRSFEATEGVNSVVFSADGGSVVAAGEGNPGDTIKIWSASTGQHLKTLQGHNGWTSSVAFFPKRPHLVATAVHSLIVLDVQTGRELRTIDAHSSIVSTLAFSPDGAYSLSGDNDGTIRLWNAGTWQPVWDFFAHPGGVRAVAFSHDGSRLLTGGSDNAVKLWDTRTGRLVHTLHGHIDAVSSVGFSADGRRLFSAGGDSSIRIWDAGTRKLLVSLFGTSNGEWLALTPDGFFAASGDAARMLAVVRGMELTTISQVHQSLFNPDLVRAALAGDPDGEVRDAAKIINLEKVLDSGPAPLVAITSHVEGSQSKSDVVSVQARFTDRGKGIGRIEWRVNGVTATVTTKAAGSGLDYVLTQQLALEPGQNVIEVVAYNASNLLASLPSRTTITLTGSADQTKPNLYILAIGINAYRDGGWTGSGGDDSVFAPLTLARKDAETFAAHIEKAAAGQYGEVRVTKALDEQATRDNLNKLINQIGRQIHPRDTFLLFAAAHGKSVAGRYYLIPQDYDGGSDPAALAKRAIDQGMLQDWLANRIKAKKALVFLDTCESGALIAGHSRSRTDAASEAAVGRLHEATGRPVLTASATRQYAYEDNLDRINVRHGLFTWALLQALRQGDSNGNGLIELSELVAYVQDQVPKLAAKLGGIGSTKSASGGAIIPVDFKQSARFGSRGEDFVLTRRLQ